VTTVAGAPARLAVATTSYERTKKAHPDETEVANIETATDRHGYFVMFFHSLPAAEQDVDVTVSHGGAGTTVTVTIREGRTTGTTIVLP
jgi:hypothetical protein